MPPQHDQPTKPRLRTSALLRAVAIIQKACEYQGEEQHTSWVVAWAMHGRPPQSKAAQYTEYAEFLDLWDEGIKEAMRLEEDAVKAAIAEPILFWSGDRADTDWKPCIPDMKKKVTALAVAAAFVTAALGEATLSDGDLQALEEALVDVERLCQALPPEQGALKRQLLADLAEMRLLLRQYAIHGNRVLDRVGRIAAHATKTAQAAGSDEVSRGFAVVWQRSHECVGLVSNLLQIGGTMMKALPSMASRLLPPGLAE